MEAIKRQIFVLRDTLKDVIDYNIGTDMVPIEYHVMDFAVPETAAAVVYVLKSNGELDKILADILDNVISFCPTKGFFTEGLNAIQIRVVDNNKALVSFTETVRARKNMKFDDDAEAQQKTLIEQLLTKIGESDGNMKIERVERIAGDENEKTERNKAIAAEQKEREKEIDVERQRINNLAKLQEGSTTGDAELADVRVGADGKTYENAGEAVRGQVTALKEDLNDKCVNDYDLYEYSENRLHLNNLMKNMYVTKYGKLEQYDGWALSDYLPVEKNSIYVWATDYLYQTRVSNIYYGLYDINKKWIGCGTTESPDLDERKFIKTDANTAYVRVSQKNEFFTDDTMIIKESILNDGINAFIPFRRDLKLSSVGKISEEIEKISEEISGIENKTDFIIPYSQPNYDAVVRSIERIGDGMSYPHHSENAFKEAYKKGFRILLCDLRFTSDNIGVCFHDDFLNQHYKDVYNSEGKLVDTGNPIYVNKKTYAELSQYDYGLYKGQAYKGYPLLKFEEMLILSKKLGVELYVEVKSMTQPQAKIACELVEKHGMSEKTSWSGALQQMQYVITNIQTARVSTMPSEVTDKVIQDLVSLKTGRNKVFVFGWDTTTLTDAIIEKLITNNIAFECGTPKNETEILNYFKKGSAYYYCTGIETSSIIAGKVILENELE